MESFFVVTLGFLIHGFMWDGIDGGDGGYFSYFLLCFASKNNMKSRSLFVFILFVLIIASVSSCFLKLPDRHWPFFGYIDFSRWNTSLVVTFWRQRCGSIWASNLLASDRVMLVKLKAVSFIWTGNSYWLTVFSYTLPIIVNLVSDAPV